MISHVLDIAEEKMTTVRIDICNLSLFIESHIIAVVA